MSVTSGVSIPHAGGFGAGMAGATFGRIALTASQMRYLRYLGIGASLFIPGVGGYRAYRAGKYAQAAVWAAVDIGSGAVMAWRYSQGLKPLPAVTVTLPPSKQEPLNWDLDVDWYNWREGQGPASSRYARSVRKRGRKWYELPY